MSVKHIYGPGKYFLGDICYALNDDIYDKVWGEKYGYEDGVFQYGNDENNKFSVASTAYGDGTYALAEDGSIEFSVDAGNIGVVPEALWGPDTNEEELDRLGWVVTVLKGKELSFEATGKPEGLFTFSVNGNESHVDTAGGSEDEYERDEDDEWGDEDSYEDAEEVGDPRFEESTATLDVEDQNLINRIKDESLPTEERFEAVREFDSRNGVEVDYDTEYGSHAEVVDRFIDSLDDEEDLYSEYDDINVETPDEMDYLRTDQAGRVEDDLKGDEMNESTKLKLHEATESAKLIKELLKRGADEAEIVSQLMDEFGMEENEAIRHFIKAASSQKVKENTFTAEGSLETTEPADTEVGYGDLAESTLPEGSSQLVSILENLFTSSESEYDTEEIMVGIGKSIRAAYNNSDMLDEDLNRLAKALASAFLRDEDY